MTATAPRRSWLFLQGADREVLLAAGDCGTDVAIQDLEDFTPAGLKDQARGLTAEICAHWRERGVVPAVRVTPLDEAAAIDTRAAVSGGAAVIVLAKAETGAEIRELDRLISYEEGRAGRSHGEVEICPTIESPSALMKLREIVEGSDRVRAAILASEDLATNLGVSRTLHSEELRHARGRFRFEAAAHGILAVDCPFTFEDPDARERDLEVATQLGYRAKSIVRGADARQVNAWMEASPAEVQRAERLVEAFERATAAGHGQVLFEGRVVELPAYTAAQRMLASRGR